MLGSCWDPAQKEQGEGLRFVSSFSHLPSPLCFQLNAVAEIFEAVQGFYLLILLQEQQVLASVEHVGLVCAQQMVVFPSCKLPGHRGHAVASPLLLCHTRRGEITPLPCWMLQGSLWIIFTLVSALSLSFFFLYSLFHY